MGETVIRAGLFALGCNLDTLLLVLVYAAGGWRPGGRTCLILCLGTTGATALALALGRLAGALPHVGRIGGGVLILLGVWTALQSLRAPREEGPSPAPGDGWAQGWRLTAALALNNAGAGVAEGAAGLSIPAGALASLGCTLLFLWLGQRLARVLPRRLAQRLAGPLSGGLLALLGLLEALE